MSKVGMVAWREFKHTALTKAFIFGAIVFPLVGWAAFPLIMIFTQEESPPLIGTIVIVDESDSVMEFAGQEFEVSSKAEQMQDSAEGLIENAQDAQNMDPADMMNPDLEDTAETAGQVMDIISGGFEIDVTLVDGDPEKIEQYKAQVRDGEILALAIMDPELFTVRLDDETGKQPNVDFFSSTDIRPIHNREIKRRLGDAIVEARVDGAGLDLKTIRAATKRPSFESQSVTAEGEEIDDTSTIKQILPFAALGLIWMVTFTSGQYLLTTTIEEKSNKVMEVLLSAISPMQLMTGKILGQALVALVMLFMYGGLAIAAAILFASLTDVVTPTMVITGIIYFIMAYFFIASTMAALGSAVNDLHEAQTLMAPVMMFLIMGPMLLMFPASQNPNGMIATVFSFIPPFIPFVMAARVAADEIPMIQIIASIGIGSVATYFSIWGAARIFRVGVLMTGKPPTPLQLLKWVTYK